MVLHHQVLPIIYLDSPMTWMRFVHRWTTIVHVMLCVWDVTDKWNSWLAYITFDWRHMFNSSCCLLDNNQIRRFITFLHRLLCPHRRGGGPKGRGTYCFWCRSCRRRLVVGRWSTLVESQLVWASDSDNRLRNTTIDYSRFRDSRIFTSFDALGVH